MQILHVHTPNDRSSVKEFFPWIYLVHLVVGERWHGKLTEIPAVNCFESRTGANVKKYDTFSNYGVESLFVNKYSVTLKIL